MMAVGDAGCGKTCLITSFSKNAFWDKHIIPNLHSEDVEDKEVVVITGRNELKISIFSTSGETFVRLARLCGCHV